MGYRTLLLALVATALAVPADAQLFRRKAAGPVRPPPKDLPAAEAAIWPFPPPDPKAWWDDKRPDPPAAADPLGGRRLGRNARLLAIDNGVDPNLYRLWGLSPLQWQVVQGDEMILEVWTRPARSVRQTVTRIVVRRDGETFLQARAGLACCEAGIGRRMGFDVQLPAGSAAAFLGLRDHPMWSAPRDVRVADAGGAADTICVDGVSYDLTLVVAGHASSLRRACDDAEIGQAADALEPVLRGALGHDPRFDVLFPGGIDFGSARRAYQALVAEGGALKRDPDAGPQAPGPPPD